MLGDIVGGGTPFVVLLLLIANSGELDGEIFCEAGDVGAEQESLGVVLRCCPPLTAC